ncbi:resolvase [Hyphomicrobium sp. xq]|uniref:Resolvase n=1 Tax=Hyphomicrobium album TaxID=2665159 RepID=A0A6I3KFH7_9HYPH|nr:recombinase family protein [Hyphomicrobium album]MTD93113.1 resolvase [Hyphomicrobium album]
MARVAIYARVSTDAQTTANQLEELHRWAARSGHDVVAVHEDRGISGSKGRAKRPGLDRLLKDAVRRNFDIVAVWSSDRLGRSMKDLLDILQTIRETRRGLYIHTQALDTTTPAGRALYQMLGVFAELEREMIVARVNAGIARARSSGTRSGKSIGRPRGADFDIEKIKAGLLRGASVRDVVAETGASVGTVAAARKALVVAGRQVGGQPSQTRARRVSKISSSVRRDARPGSDSTALPISERSGK